MSSAEEQIRDAIIDGEITRAEEIGIEKGNEIGMEKGKEIGIEEGEKNIIKKMLKKEQVREVKSKISDIKKLKKELELPPEVTQPDEDLVSQINNAIANDETLEALKDTRDIDALKVEKAKLEIPDIELSIDLPMGGMDNGEVKKNEVELPKATVEVEEVCEKPYYEKAAEKIIEFDDDLESFFADNDDLF